MVDDWVALGLLLLIFLQGFVIEGLRIATTELAQQPDLARWSPGGWPSRWRSPGSVNPGSVRLHRIVWWFHAVTAFAFLGYFAWGKLAHVFFGTANIFLRNLGPTRAAGPRGHRSASRERPGSPRALGTNGSSS